MAARAKGTKAQNLGFGTKAIDAGLALKAATAPTVIATGTAAPSARPCIRDCTRQVRMWYSTYPSSLATTSDDECKRCTDVTTSHELTLSLTDSPDISTVLQSILVFLRPFRSMFVISSDLGNMAWKHVNCAQQLSESVIAIKVTC